MQTHRHRLLFLPLVIGLLTVLLLLSSCKSAPPIPTLVPSRTIAFNPYRTPTASLTPADPASQALATIPVTPTPTATPYLHTVKKNETMLGIAITYGIELTDLLSANPQVDPHFMSIGITLTIPLTGEAFASVPVITPVPLKIDPPECYRSADGGTWCLALVHNDRETAVENVTAVIGLFNEAGDILAAQEAILPLNRLGPGDSLPLGAYFPPPLPADFTSWVELLTAVDVNESAGRYLNADIQVNSSDISPQGLDAHLTGSIIITTSQEIIETLPAQLIWVTAVAYDEEGKVVGVRKWESTALMDCNLPDLLATPGVTPTSLPPLPEICFQFDLTVYSLGPPIARVEVLAEARP